MGRRSRKRRAAEHGSAPTAVAERPSAPAKKPVPPRRGYNPRSSRQLDEGPPPAPWHPFPLAELCIFVSLVLVIIGFIVWDRTGQILIGVGAVLGALGTLEFTIREHVGGYRSHSTLLAGFLGVAVGIVAFFARAPQFVVLAAALVVFAASFFGLRELFKRSSGGLGWRGGLK